MKHSCVLFFLIDDPVGIFYELPWNLSKAWFLDYSFKSYSIHMVTVTSFHITWWKFSYHLLPCSNGGILFIQLFFLYMLVNKLNYDAICNISIFNLLFKTISAYMYMYLNWNWSLFISPLTGGSTIKVWDALAGGKLLASVSNHHKTVTCMCFCSDYKRLLSGSLDRSATWVTYITYILEST